jgi:DNA polymerase kappa
LRKNEAEANKIFSVLEDSRNLSRTIIHVDMDGKAIYLTSAFYASVEELDNPALKNRPMAVGVALHNN